jgi:predicted DNA-binding transcriptional regulator AlpA
VSDKTAAKMLDLPKAEFQRLVGEGVLPRPVKLGDAERWRVEDLQRALDGQQTGLGGW